MILDDSQIRDPEKNMEILQSLLQALDISINQDLMISYWNHLKPQW